jgi:hypothetical protein
MRALPVTPSCSFEASAAGEASSGQGAACGSTGLRGAPCLPVNGAATLVNRAGRRMVGRGERRGL